MSRPGAVTFKGAPLTLAGEAVAIGQDGPDFTLHYFEDGMLPITLAEATFVKIIDISSTGPALWQFFRNLRVTS